MGMCAIYTAVPPPSEESLIVLARDNESRVYGARRCTLGRRAIAELAAALAPETHRAFARTIVERDLWGFLTPAATRGNHFVALAEANEDLELPVPLWPATVELACLVGIEPARYIGNNLVMLPPPLVREAVDAFDRHQSAHEAAEIVGEFLRGARDRGDAVLLHWDYR